MPSYAGTEPIKSGDYSTTYKFKGWTPELKPVTEDIEYEAVFEGTPAVRVYFSLEDQMFEMYKEEAGFEKMFKLIDFTEKYDPWRQIRRVLAKTMEKRLHKQRLMSMDEDSPLITLLIQGTKSAALQGNERPHLTSKLDAPCFCGSGKPFRECHGKKK